MPKRLRGIIQTVLISRQHFGLIPTYCTRCNKKQTFKIVKGDGSYTLLCNCGCTIYQYHKPDKFHATSFFTKKFIPAKAYDPSFKNKDPLEKMGLIKTEKQNGRKVYSK